jgi:hypothetical protein
LVVIPRALVAEIIPVKGLYEYVENWAVGTILFSPVHTEILE